MRCLIGCCVGSRCSPNACKWLIALGDLAHGVPANACIIVNGLLCVVEWLVELFWCFYSLLIGLACYGLLIGLDGLWTGRLGDER